MKGKEGEGEGRGGRRRKGRGGKGKRRGGHANAPPPTEDTFATYMGNRKGGEGGGKENEKMNGRKGDSREVRKGMFENLSLSSPPRVLCEKRIHGFTAVNTGLQPVICVAYTIIPRAAQVLKGVILF